MFINGSKEWIGKNAHTFLLIRTALEKKLLSLEFEYFYGGIISKRSVYESHIQMLGSYFTKVFVDFLFKDKKYILSPEYTFRVYEYLNRNNLLNKENKIFYSQEMMRNESLLDIEEGKTFSFWQIGYEIFGQDDTLLSIDSISTLYKCLQELPLDDLYFRITDKRIFKSLCKQYSIDDMLEVSALMDVCNEDGDSFYSRYIKEGGNPVFAEKLRYLMKLSSEGRLTFDILKDTLNGKTALEAIESLEEIYNALGKVCGQQSIVLVPYMPKTWDAYTTFIYDARVPGYEKAIAGGGNLFIDPTNPNCTHSGVGIGVTRIAEYLIARGLDIESRESAS
ncbi:Histidyl-tRNA synthetase-like protein [Alkaliphilus metalliredigens QYMF]|uniref:Histidyl-tRNA synthetase-like protein n=1 Tax=Alkaliphilus metalliredigens (strain QYMF) TaxID=293826 RepID=A6TPU6_ALKMQ|nr:ATP phosphoribosyltransferase regulatory subunit [Alkaliphilus metalliredigens]ABR48214.1 Histidyl-tRNA synthetase-like protein [Alkaliphilus metalliredigens QYMF]